jgi:citrate synthase
VDRLDQRGFDNQRSEFVAADEAARLLGVKRETLYAYASRGLVRSEPGPRGRGHRYSRSDLERLRTRVDARAGHGPVAAAALRFGEPVLATAISRIDADGPKYRGESAVELAARATSPRTTTAASYESVAELLWSGARPLATEWPSRDAAKLVAALRGQIPTGMPPLYTLLAVTPRLALLDPGRFASPREADMERAKTLIRALAACAALSFGAARLSSAVSAGRIPEVVAAALGAPARAVPVIEQTLILCADHELNASTFAARVVASTGADLYACLTAALAAMTGPRHGGASDRVEALCDEVTEPRRAAAVVAARASRGEAMPGFGHPLYPSGDPRVPPLLEATARAAKKSRGVAVVLAVAEAMKRAHREPPNLDFGLVGVARALGLPKGSASLLFAIGRTAGWVAHALEQREAGYVLRPRSKYVGPEPA